MKPDTGSFVQVAAVTGAHGVRGQVKIRILIPALEALPAALTDKNGKIYAVKSHSQKGLTVIASLKGIDDRNAAEVLKGLALYAPADKVPQSATDVMIGLKAILASGKPYGEVIAAYNFGAGDIIEILQPDGEIEMLPLNEDFVGKIDTVKKTVIITPPDYLEGDKD